MLAIVALALVLAPPPAGGARAFEGARKVALGNAKTSAGKRYQAVFAKAFSESQAKELGRCVESQVAPDLTAFEALVRIGKGGTVEDVLVRPGTNVAACLRESIRKTKFPVPPRPGYWTSTTLRLSH